MDADRFDALSRALSTSHTRRRLPRLLGGLSLGGVLSGVIQEAAAAEVLDARCPDPGGEPQGYKRDLVAQTFLAKRGGELVRATVWFTEAGAGGTDDCRISIRTTDRKGRPTARVLAEALVTGVADPLDGQTTEVTADFTVSSLGPARVKKGKGYALVVAAASGTNLYLQLNLNGGCAGALFDFNGETSKWERNRIVGDLVFETFVERS
jgi:hypothetical protein